MTPDLNAIVANLIEDLAEIQESKQSQMGYRRAAHAVLLLEQPITALIEPGADLPVIPNVGPKSLRVIKEVLETGRSDTVEAAVDASGQRTAIDWRRARRVNFLSRARVIEALEDPRLGGPRRADYLGDLQMHSEWSDGKTTVAAMAAACVERGYRYAAMTDHSHGLPSAHGLTGDDLKRQRAEIDEINQTSGDRFCLLAGVEANIGLDGSLDLTAAELREVDLVVAAAHAGLRIPGDQTRRMIAAVQAPGVHILGHPRGRVRGNRHGIEADWDLVFEAAARANVAIEIDGDPARQDLDHAMARRAVEAGCVLALDSDAHAPLELGFADVALAHARLAGVPADQILNCWPLGRLLDWLGQRA